MDGDAEHRARRERDRAELARRAQEHRDEAANQVAARTPGVLDTLDDMQRQIASLRTGLANAIEAGDTEEEPPRRAWTPRVIQGGREAG